MAATESTTLVNNTWNNSKDATLATKDVYTAPTESVVSAAPEVANAAANKTKSLLKTTASNLRGVVKAVKTINELKNAISNGDTFSRIAAGAPALSKALAACGISTPEALAKYVDQAAGMSAKVGNLVREVKAVDFNNVDAAGKLLAKYTGDNDIFKIADVGATTATALSVIHACVSNGIPNSIPSVLGVLSEDGELNKVLGGSLPVVISKSDFESLNDVADAFGSSLKLISPSIAADFTAAFSKPLYWKDGSFTSLSDALTKVDPAWNVGSISSETTINLTNVINGSSEFKTVVSDYALTTPDANGKITTAQAMLVFGNSFQKTTVEAELKQTFPLTVYSTSTVTKNEVINPLLVGSI